MIDTAINSLSNLVDAYPLLAPLFAFLGGALTSITPCSLSTIPLVIGYVSNSSAKDDPKKALKFSLVFALGMAVTFTAIGVTASLAGRMISQANTWWYLILGILMILMALQTWGVINLIPATYLVSKNKRRGYIGALISGILGGLFSSPCATPMLVALIAIVAFGNNLAYGVLLFFCYSIGSGILTVLAGTSIGFVKRIRQGRASQIASMILGILILALGLYMLYLGF